MPELEVSHPPITRVRDQDLVARTLGGDRDAFGDLVDRYSGGILGSPECGSWNENGGTQ